MPFLQENQKKSLSDIAVDYIKINILSGHYKSGDRLIESNISSVLGISRAPVREAMRQLNVEGIVTFLPRRGNSVLDLALEESLEIFEIRRSLEKQILEILLDQDLLDGDDIEELKTIVADMLSYEYDPKSPHSMLYQLNSRDLQFHEYLWRASGSKHRAQILEILFYQLLMVMNRNTITLGTFKEKALEHRRVLQGLEEKDLHKTLQEFDSHMDAYIRALKDNVFPS